jgi:N-acetylglucosamine repressor
MGQGFMRKINTRSFHPATRTTSREVNRQILLNFVRERQPISRADLARQTGMGRSMITSLVNELIENELVYERATGYSSRGRRPRLLHIRVHDRLAIAVDVRLHQTHLLLSDFGGREIALETFRTPASPEELACELATRVQRVREAHAAIGDCEGVGLVIPGMVDHATGLIPYAPSLGWCDVDLRGMLAEQVALPVYMERDAVACALAHTWMGRASGDAVDSFVYMTVSDGIGASLVSNGMIFRGRGDAAGEFGHIPLNLDGPPCLCGARGCLEVYASNPATIARYVGRELSTREDHTRLRESEFTITDLVARARSGDSPARAALEATSRFLGVGLAVVVNTLSPSRVIVGGEITSAWEILEPVMRKALAERALTLAAAETPIHPEPTDRQTRLRGATALVLAPVFAAPRIA